MNYTCEVSYECRQRTGTTAAAVPSERGRSLEELCLLTAPGVSETNGSVLPSAHWSPAHSQTQMQTDYVRRRESAPVRTFRSNLAFSEFLQPGRTADAAYATPLPFHQFISERAQLSALVATDGGDCTGVNTASDVPGWVGASCPNRDGDSFPTDARVYGTYGPDTPQDSADGSFAPIGTSSSSSNRVLLIVSQALDVSQRSVGQIRDDDRLVRSRGSDGYASRHPSRTLPSTAIARRDARQ